MYRAISIVKHIPKIGLEKITEWNKQRQRERTNYKKLFFFSKEGKEALVCHFEITAQWNYFLRISHLELELCVDFEVQV